MICYYHVLLKCSLLSSIKLSSTSQFIKGKLRDLQKSPKKDLQRYLSGIVTFTFKNDTDGCGGRSACPEFWSCGNLSGVSPTISVLY